VAGLGDALTASFRQQGFRARRLQPGQAKQIIVDFDMSALLPAEAQNEHGGNDVYWSQDKQILRGLMPEAEQLRLAAEQVCKLLDTVECGHVVSFKLDLNGDVVTHKFKPKTVAVQSVGIADVMGLNREKGNSQSEEDTMFSRMTMRDARGSGPMVLGIVSVLGLLITAGVTLKVLKRGCRRNQLELGKIPDAAKEFDNRFGDEKKPEVEDDTVSTVTPVSLAHSAISDEDLPADRV
jgi:hypothetical protein